MSSVSSAQARPVAKEMLTTQEAAQEFGLSASWLAKLRVTGEGARYAKLGAKVMYRRSDFEQWIESQLRSTTSDPGRIDRPAIGDKKPAVTKPRERRLKPSAKRRRSSRTQRDRSVAHPAPAE